MQIPYLGKILIWNEREFSNKGKVKLLLGKLLLKMTKKMIEGNYKKNECPKEKASEWINIQLSVI